MSATRIHPETGEVLHREVRQQTVRFGSLSRVVDVPGWYPQGDGDAIFTGADLKTSNEAFKELREDYAGHVRAVRKAHGLTQEEAGRIIGGGRRAFQKYESGKTPPSEAAVGLIEVLARHPETLVTLRSIRPQITAVAAAVAGLKKVASPGKRKPARRLAKARG